MAGKKHSAKKGAAVIPPKLTPTESHLLRLMEKGYELETSPEGGALLRNRRTNEMIRPTSANMNTVQALQERGLIRPMKGRNPFVTIWRVGKQAK